MKIWFKTKPLDDVEITDLHAESTNGDGDEDQMEAYDFNLKDLLD